MTNWNFSPEIQIVYSVYGSISHNGKTYPKAYIVKKDDKKSLDSAVAWATESRYYKTTVVPKIVETTNEGFSMQIAAAPGNSSQSGKLAFWMCCFEKPGVEPFATGINSELLALVILQSVLDHGKLNETVCFARNSSQLGVLHTNMPEYTQMQNDMNAKAQMKAKKKTKNWRTGYTYSTATQSDIMMGYFPKHITYCEETDSWGVKRNNDA